jgi:hypothetical protein
MPRWPLEGVLDVDLDHRLAAQRLGDELPAARVVTNSRPPAAAVQTTSIGGRRSDAVVNRRLRPVSSIALSYGTLRLNEKKQRAI